MVHGSGQQLRVIDLTDNSVGAVYLFRRNGTLDPGAGKHYVQYDFSLASGDYKTTYRFADGPNPENSRVTTPYYSHHFGDRWQSDELEITAPGASGVDILDRHKNLFAPSNCGRSEDTFDDAEGAFVVNKVGPVPRSARTSARTADRTRSAPTSSTTAARTSRPTCGSTRSRASWTSSTTAPRRSA